MLRERGLMSSRILFLHDNSLTVPLPGKRERLYLALHISEYLLGVVLIISGCFTFVNGRQFWWIYIGEIKLSKCKRWRKMLNHTQFCQKM